jgi:kynurenine formamidase
LGSFVGSTRQGGSCNVDRISLIPHCNGTHVEHVGHIVDQIDGQPLERVPAFMLAALVSVTPEPAGNSPSESYRPHLNPDDQIIRANSLQAAWSAASLDELSNFPALVVRTLPNPLEKQQRQYNDTNAPPFLTVEAIQWIVDRKFQHILVDFPSIDRMHDDGLLTNHHVFWRVTERTHKAGVDAQTQRSISEMVFVPNSVKDGLYLLNLQFPDWDTDAAPARPLLFALQNDDDSNE